MNGGIDSGINGRGPTAAGKAGHVVGAIVWEIVSLALTFEVIEADDDWFEKVFDAAAGGGRLNEGVVIAAAIAGAHVGHEGAED